MQRKNEELKKEKKSFLERSGPILSKRELLLKKSADPALLESIRAEMLAEKRAHTRKIIVLLSFLALIVGALALYLFSQKVADNSLEGDKYYGYVQHTYAQHFKQGQEALKLQQWDVAEASFQQILTYLPEHKEATYYLAKTYCMRCLAEKNGCDQARSMVASHLTEEWYDYKALKALLDGK